MSNERLRRLIVRYCEKNSNYGDCRELVALKKVVIKLELSDLVKCL